MGLDILKSWNYSFEIGKMAPSHSESIIVIMPKEGKDIADIKNWCRMSPVPPVFHTEVTVSIGLKASFRVGTSIPQI